MTIDKQLFYEIINIAGHQHGQKIYILINESKWWLTQGLCYSVFDESHIKRLDLTDVLLKRLEIRVFPLLSINYGFL
jgi:hypothetical protein